MNLLSTFVCVCVYAYVCGFYNYFSLFLFVSLCLFDCYRTFFFFIYLSLHSFCFYVAVSFTDCYCCLLFCFVSVLFMFSFSSHLPHSFIHYIFTSFRFVCSVPRVPSSFSSNSKNLPVSSTISRRSPLPGDPFLAVSIEKIRFFTFFFLFFFLVCLFVFFLPWTSSPFGVTFRCLSLFLLFLSSFFSYRFAWVLDFLLSSFMLFFFTLYRSRFEPRGSSTVRSVFPRSTRASKNHSGDT